MLKMSFCEYVVSFLGQILSGGRWCGAGWARRTEAPRPEHSRCGGGRTTPRQSTRTSRQNSFSTTKLVSFFFLTRKKIKSNAKTATTSTTSTTLTTTTTLTTLTTTTTAKTSLARSFAHRLVSRIKLSMRGFNDFVQREDEDWETRAVTTLNTNWRRKGSARGAGGGREGEGGGISTQADLSAD